MKRHPVGYFAPPPGSPTGVADYAVDLRLALEAADPSLDLRLNDDEPSDAIYHLGNNHHHAAIMRRALANPGLLILHDATLHHFYLGQLSEHDYLAEVVAQYGSAFAARAQQWWDQRHTSAANREYFDHGLLGTVASRSRVVAVHSAMAAERVRREAPRAPVIVVPHLRLQGPPVEPSRTQSLRDEWGASAETVILGLFGHLRETKRVASVVRALERAARERDLLLVLSGDAVESSAELAWNSTHPRIRRLPALPEPMFSTALAACDVGVTLRYPSAGETSGLGIRFLSLGVPLLTTDGPLSDGLPEVGCLRVSPPPREQEHLEELLFWMRRDKLAVLGAAGRVALSRDHQPHAVAHLLLPHVTLTRSSS